MTTQTEMLQKIIDGQSAQNSRLAVLENQMSDLTKAIKGNGQPGLIDRFNKVENNQKNCIKNHQGLKADWKFLLTAAIAIIAVLKEYIK